MEHRGMEFGCQIDYLYGNIHMFDIAFAFVLGMKAKVVFLI